MPSSWTGLLLVYVCFYLLGVAPPPLGRLAAEVTPPTRITGLYVADAVLTGNGRALVSALHHLMLPALTLGFAVMAPLTRMVRATMLEILASDYIKAAWRRASRGGASSMSTRSATRSSPSSPCSA